MTEESQGSQQSDVDGLELYKVAVDEYRFEVTLGWQRSQYLLALNAAIISVGTGLLNTGDEGPARSFLTACIFGVGLFTAGFSMITQRTQHVYYTATRDRMKETAESFGLSEWAVRTTPGMGAKGFRWIKVTTAILILFCVMALVDVLGLLLAARHSLGVAFICLGVMCCSASLVASRRLRADSDPA